MTSSRGVVIGADTHLAPFIWLSSAITERLHGEGVAPEDASRCSALLVTQLVGVINARYVLAADPVAATPKQAFIDGVTPALSAALDQCVGRRR